MSASPPSPHTDINSDGWIVRFLPKPAQPYALMARLDRPIGVWLLLLPGWWAIALGAGGLRAMNFQDVWIAILFAAGAVLMRAAGCVINDLWDRRLDQQVERTRTRPLAAGTVSPLEARIFLMLLLLPALIILCQLSLVAILLGILSLPLIVIYPLAKRFTWWPQLMLGVVFNFGALMGWAAVTGVVGLPALLLYMGGILWTLGYDTIYAHQDIADDSLIGIKSTALKFGPAARTWVKGFFSAAWILIFLAFLGAHAGFLPLLALAAPAWHLRWQLQNWDPADPASSLMIFRANRDFGLLVALAALLQFF